MSEKTAITFRTSKENLAIIDEIARQGDRSRNYIIDEALNKYAKEHREYVLSIEKAIDEADRGESYNVEDVMGALMKDLQEITVEYYNNKVGQD